MNQADRWRMLSYCFHTNAIRHHLLAGINHSYEVLTESRAKGFLCEKMGDMRDIDPDPRNIYGMPYAGRRVWKVCRVILMEILEIPRPKMSATAGKDG
jgi:hypothetical protein